jgi:outer membrane protein, heavy metal efflux system
MSNLYFKPNGPYRGLMMFGMLLSCMLPSLVLGQLQEQSLQNWTLQKSVQRVIEIAPEMHAADANMGLRQSELRQAAAWPNPSLSLRVDQKLGKDANQSRLDITEVSFSQPLPLLRLDKQRSVAAEQLSGAQQKQHHQKLLLENRTAQVFHDLQQASAFLKLAEQRLAVADKLIKKMNSKGRSGVVRYLSPLEKLRLAILREEAHEALAEAEGAYNEKLSAFRTLLGLSAETIPVLAELKPVADVLPLDDFIARLASHAALIAEQHAIDAAQKHVELTKATRIADPTISLFNSRDTFDTGRDDYWGAMLSVQIPLWGENKPKVSKARFTVAQAQARRSVMERDLLQQLRLSYLHLKHIREQTEHTYKEFLLPSEKMLKLTAQAFAVGEVNVMSYIDANYTYFDAQVNYLKKLHEANTEIADLYLAAGLSQMSAPDLSEIVPGGEQ